MKKLSTTFGSIITSLFFAATPAFAADIVIPTVTAQEASASGKTVGSIVELAVKWVLGFSAAIAVLFIIIAGLQMLTSAGNEERYKAAKKTLTYAVIGLLVVVLALAIVSFVIKLPSDVGITTAS